MEDQFFILPEEIIEKYKNNPFLKNLTVTKCGCYERAKGHFIRRTGIDEYILIYCIDGEGWLGIEDTVLTISKGNLLIINKNTHHSYGASANNPWTIQWVHFIGEGAIKLINIGKLTQNGYLEVGYQPRLIDQFLKIFGALNLNYYEMDMIRASTYLQTILCEIIELQEKNNSEERRYKEIINVINFIEANLEENHSLDSLAQYTGLSKYHFSRKFKEYTHYAPMEYIKRFKVQKACDLLKKGELSIGEVSIQLQFNSPQYFSECFKQVTGYTPNKFRRLMQDRI